MVTKRKKKNKKIQWGCSTKGGYRYVNSKKRTKSRFAKGIKNPKKTRKTRRRRRKKNQTKRRKRR